MTRSIVFGTAVLLVSTMMTVSAQAAGARRRAGCLRGTGEGVHPFRAVEHDRQPEEGLCRHRHQDPRGGRGDHRPVLDRSVDGVVVR